MTAHPDEGSFDAEIVDAAGNQFVELVGYRTVALPDVLDSEALDRMLATAGVGR